MSEILTKSQELRHFGPTLEALKNLVAAPESKDLLHNILLGVDGIRADGVDETLFLTKEGLLKVTVNDFTELVEPSIKLVRKFHLAENDLVNLLNLLRA